MMLAGTKALPNLCFLFSVHCTWRSVDSTEDCYFLIIVRGHSVWSTLKVWTIELHQLVFFLVLCAHRSSCRCQEHLENAHPSTLTKNPPDHGSPSHFLHFMHFISRATRVQHARNHNYIYWQLHVRSSPAFVSARLCSSHLVRCRCQSAGPAFRHRGITVC